MRSVGHRILSTLFLVAVSMLIPLIGVLAQGQAPSVETLPATDVTQTAAVLWGSVNPNGIPTTWDFADPATGASYCPSPAGLTDASTSPITVNCLASGLSPSTSYQYALRASNRAGSVTGNVVTFTTLAATSTVSGFDFAMSVVPSTLTVIAGGSGTYTVTVNLVSGLTQNVYLTVFGLPTGVAGSFFQPSGYPSFISTLVVNVPTDAQSGPYSLTIVATSGNLVKTASALLVVTGSTSSTTSYTTQGITLSADLYVSSFGTNEVKAYDGTGAFVKTFASGGGLGLPVGLVFGPDGNLYVSNPTSNNVLRYDGTTGTFIDVFASTGGLTNPQGLWFGPNGNLYVTSFNTNDIKQYNGANGAYVGSWSFPVGTNCGPEGLVFGPYESLYVSCSAANTIARFNSTGWFMGSFVASGSGGLSNPQGLAFGPDGNLYVSSFNTNEVKRYSGTTGVFGSNFASGGGLVNPNGLTFGPDGNLYVSSFGTNDVKRYNGATGAYMGTFASGGGLVRPTLLTFRESPVVITQTTQSTTFGSPGFFIEGVEQKIHGVFMPLTLYLRPGETARIQFMIRVIGDFRQRVSLELSPSVAGLSASFDPSSGFPDFVSTLTLQASQSIAPALYELRIIARGGGIIKSSGIELVVTQNQETATGIATIATVPAWSLPLTTGPHKVAETTAVVISPGMKPNACPPGRLLVSSGDAHQVFYKDLDKLGGQTKVTPPFQTGSEELITDNILVRLTNGDLILSWEGRGLNNTVPPPNNIPGGNPTLIQKWLKTNGGKRGAIFLWGSTNCGDSWLPLPPIDMATVGDGRCAWPREGEWGGGMDRHEMYVDPWNGNIYVTFQCTGGGKAGFPPLISRTYLLTLPNGGNAWTSLVLYEEGYAPSIMTSTSSGRLFVGTCVPVPNSAYGFHLYWIDSPWTAIKDETYVFYGEAAGTKPENTKSQHRCNAISAGDLLPVKTTQPGLAPLGLSRVDSTESLDRIRVAYPGVAGSSPPHQVEYLVGVSVGLNGKLNSITDMGIIEAEEAGGSILQATFIETDRVDLSKQDKTTDRILLYWVETSPTGQSLFARYTTMWGTLPPEPIKDLSFSSGKRVTWVPDGEWTGDYMKGGFYFDGTNLNFAPVWPQSGPKGSTNLHFNIIKIPLKAATSSQCLIATAAYGSEISPELQFLLQFRDGSIMKTRAGSNFLIAFNAWYYSFSPRFAQFISQQAVFKTVTRSLLYPLLGILKVGRAVFEAVPANPEGAAILTGITIASLIGAVYFTMPMAAVLSFTPRGRSIAKRFEKPAAVILAGGLVLVGLGELQGEPGLMILATSITLLACISLSALVSSRIAVELVRSRYVGKKEA